MSNEKKNILLVGQGAVVSALAKKLKSYDGAGEIYAAPGNCIESDIFKNIDIREDDLTGLLKFALENDIDLTIPVTDKAIKTDIVSFFQSNGQNIFGSSADAANFALNKIAGKRFLYKIHAQTSKFGIFDKLQPAEDYLKSANFPVTIKCGEVSKLAEDRLVCPTVSLAREFLSVLFSKNETDILVEEFAHGKNFTVYFITDGYSALPLTSVANYNFMEDGDGGILTSGVGCYAPDYKISEVVISRVENVVRNALVSVEKKGEPYVGILGVECVLTGEDKFYVTEFKPFLQDHDAAVVLNLCSDNLIELFMSCINGFFSDEYTSIKMNDCCSVAAVVSARQLNKKITGFDLVEDVDNIDFINVNKANNEVYLTVKGANFVLTRTAGTLSRAKKYLYEDLSQMSFDGIKYRKDIGGSDVNY